MWILFRDIPGDGVRKEYKEVKYSANMERKGQIDIKFFVGLVIIMVGVLAVTFMGLGFIFNSPTLVWVGSVVLGIISVASAVLEKVLLK